MVRDHFKLGHDWHGDSWFAGFLPRHRVELHTGHPKANAEKCTRKEILDYVKRFVSVMGRFLKEHTFTAETVYDADEREPASRRHFLRRQSTNRGCLQGRLEYEAAKGHAQWLHPPFLQRCWLLPAACDYSPPRVRRR